MSSQVTKEKNTGRVKAGHRLREWNRKNKEDLLKNQKQKPIEGKLSVEPSEISTTKHVEVGTNKSYDVYMYGVGILVILGVGVLVYFKTSKKTVVKTEPIKKVYKSIL